MPIYEYELEDGECQICPGRFEVLQPIDEGHLKFCPGCGLACKRVVSRASFKMKGDLTAEKAAKQGFTTWKRAREGEWEKVAGPGVDGIVATDEDRAAIEAERSQPKVLDLDDSD